MKSIWAKNASDVKITDTALDKKCKKYDKHILHILVRHDVLDFTRISEPGIISYVKKFTQEAKIQVRPDAVFKKLSETRML